MSKYPKWAFQLVRNLDQLADVKNPLRDVLARLRRGLIAPAYQMLIGTGGLFRDVPFEHEDTARLAAGLFAWGKGQCAHSRPDRDPGRKRRDGPNFGTAFAAGLSDDRKQQREKRFVALLDTDAEELPLKLRQAVNLMVTAGTAVKRDWVLTIHHLLYWNDSSCWVQRDWARGFWTSSAPAQEAPTSAEQPASE